MCRNTLLKLLIAASFVSLAAPTYAYLDPGTGSIILQGIIAAIATVSFAAKMYWQRIKAFFKDESESSQGEEPKEQPEHQSQD